MKIIKKTNLLILFLFLCRPIGADTLFLKNGRVIIGKIVEQNPYSVTFNVDGKPSYYQKEDILRISFGNPEEEKLRLAQEIRRRELARIAEEKKPEVNYFPDGLTIQAGLGIGLYASEWEKRHRDRTLRSFTMDGYVSSITDWNNRESSAVQAGIFYRRRPFIFELNAARVHAEPRFVENFFRQTPTSFNYMIQDHRLDINLTQMEGLAGWILTQKERRYELAVLGGLRTFYEKKIDHSIRNSGGVDTTAGDINGAWGQRFASPMVSDLHGAAGGIRGSYFQNQVLEFRGRIVYSEMRGRWDRTNQILIYNRSQVNGFSAAYQGNGETSSLHSRGWDAEAGVYWTVGEKTKIFARMNQSYVVVTDGKKYPYYSSFGAGGGSIRLNTTAFAAYHQGEKSVSRPHILWIGVECPL